jgi:transposase
MWIATQDLARAPGHLFYERLNEVLGAHRFDSFVEERCARFYSGKMGRPSIAPGVYFRMLLVGYFEGIDSERGIAWRCADSLSLREFLGYPMGRKTPDHSTVSRTRRLLDEQTHREVFTFVLKVLGEDGLVDGKTLGIDATTLEANAALRSIVRRDTGEGYEDYLKGLAKKAGLEEPTREELAKLDRRRKRKGNNKEWQHPHDPEARITKMKDGRTHLAHKLEHAVDMESGVVVGVTVQDAVSGDTTTLHETLRESAEQLEAVSEEPKCSEKIHSEWMRELVLDKGYHSNETLLDLEELRIRSYVSEPQRGRRRWKKGNEEKSRERAVVYANRRRVRGERGKRLLRKRGEHLERPFAHYLETGAMRRVHLRGRSNILKRLLVHVAGFNLGVFMRSKLGVGTPRALGALCSLLNVMISTLFAAWERIRILQTYSSNSRRLGHLAFFHSEVTQMASSATGC